tara:strand:- start:273 stop:410 length:138 start_codon:yes stop_codon:yes gene_type:complete
MGHPFLGEAVAPSLVAHPFLGLVTVAPSLVDQEEVKTVCLWVSLF